MAEQQPAAPAPAAQKTNGLAIASLVTGIVAFIFGWAIFFGFIVGVVAVILGIIGLKKPGLKGMSIAGIVTGGLGALWSLVVTIIFIIAIATLGFAGVAANEVVNDYNREGQALNSSKKDFAKGETATFATLEVKVNSVTRNYENPDSYYSAADGKEFVVVNITVKNLDDESKYVSSYDFSINENGVADTSAFADVADEFDGGDLSAGASLTGNIVYEVTAGASDLKLQYETYSYTSEGSKKLTYTLAL
jgi:hypothetical protein